MNFDLLKKVIDLLQEFETIGKSPSYKDDLDGFKQWVADRVEAEKKVAPEPHWTGKTTGRSPESVISTLLVHLNRYAKNYSKSAIYGSDFSTQEEFIYLINLRAFGDMAKMELIKKNIHEKPAGMQIINRLIKQGWVSQADSKRDKRSKVINITEAGLLALEQQMPKIRQATNIVAGDLSQAEKMDLIRLLDKLERFHQPIFKRNMSSAELLDSISMGHFQN
jgi:DNA-binding MarR family transcriptional regulator